MMVADACPNAIHDADGHDHDASHGPPPVGNAKAMPTISANIPDNIPSLFCIASTSVGDLQAKRPYFRIFFACDVFPPSIKYASGVPCVSITSHRTVFFRFER
jgi:hypothetical protein